MQKQKLPHHQPIHGTGHTVGDFWQWAYSDILNNRNRSVFAEYLVATALDVLDGVREEWDGCDLRYADLRIEVKSSSYLQAWKQKSLYKPRFDIAPKRAWQAECDAHTTEPVRYADLFVFCLFAAQEAASANVLDIAQWEFYVVPTDLLNQHFPAGKELTLAKLRTHAAPLAYADLMSAIDAVAAHRIAAKIPNSL